MTYDALILVAVWIVGSGLVVLPMKGAVEPGNSWFQLYLFLLTWGYFASGWLLGGQTVGMRAWNMRLISVRSSNHNSTIRLTDSILRVLVGSISFATFGFGFAWGLLRKDGATWHDLASHSRMVVANPVRSNQAPNERVL